MRIEDAAPRIGAVVTGVDVRSLTEPDWKVLYQTWLERHVLIVRGQALSKPDFLAYSRRFGRLKPHRVKSTRDFEYPEITLMGITTGNNTTDKLVLDRGQGWHTDGPWDAEICKATQLYALEIPSYGGDTLFASMHAAYDALPERLKMRIAPLRVEFGYGGRARKGIERSRGSEGAARRLGHGPCHARDRAQIALHQPDPRHSHPRNAGSGWRQAAGRALLVHAAAERQISPQMASRGHRHMGQPVHR